jgi:hypothetical protein
MKRKEHPLESSRLGRGQGERKRRKEGEEEGQVT